MSNQEKLDFAIALTVVIVTTVGLFFGDSGLVEKILAIKEQIALIIVVFLGKITVQEGIRTYYRQKKEAGMTTHHG